MSDSKGTLNQDIGRPGPWTETRYQQPGKSVDDTVDDAKTNAAAKKPDDISKPVSLEDYTGKKP
jgi:hypothetical protein